MRLCWGWEIRTEWRKAIWLDGDTFQHVESSTQELWWITSWSKRNRLVSFSRELFLISDFRRIVTLLCIRHFCRLRSRLNRHQIKVQLVHQKASITSTYSSTVRSQYKAGNQAKNGQKRKVKNWSKEAQSVGGCKQEHNEIECVFLGFVYLFWYPIFWSCWINFKHSCRTILTAIWIRLLSNYFLD